MKSSEELSALRVENVELQKRLEVFYTAMEAPEEQSESIKEKVVGA